ncbi:MAG: ABC transporter ATP-binding protein [Bacteroidetes bacterium]|jgi:ABC-2 type transport system ATP-binding protein|nr:ABC transporter ATP-binding protein [Bacteroidota bacterium]
MSNNILSINGITKKYGNITAVNNLSFNVPQGSIFGILGPNGSGKTTTLGIILDVLKANSGSFSWFDAPSNTNNRNRIGSLLETPNFYHYLSAFDNLKITQEINKRGNEYSIEEALHIVRLTERKNYKFKTYSLGMKQRLAIAAALLGNPDVLVFDEPTNGLDPVGIVEIRELIKQLAQQGKTIIMASHLLDEVEKVCTHVAIMKRGNLVACGDVNEIIANEEIVELNAVNNEQLYGILSNYNLVKKITQEKNYVELAFTQGDSKLDDINKYCFEKGIVLNHLTYKRKSLEVKFFELTNN